MYEWIDDAFRVEQSRFKNWKSYDKDGNTLITSFTQESCIPATRFYLKGVQEGWETDSIKYEGTIGGKL